MDKINLYVCENYAPEIDVVCKEQGMEDFTLVPYPPTCIDRRRKAEAARLFAQSSGDGTKGVVLCGNNCDACALIPAEAALEVHSGEYCFSHLVSDGLASYVLSKQGYIIGSGWLRDWLQRINDAGFDQETARSFYHDFCSELVFLDAGIDPEAKRDLVDLAHFLDLPYVVIPVDLAHTRMMISKLLPPHRHASVPDDTQSLEEMQAQSAEYAAILHLIGRISAYSSKREAIDRIKEIFIMVFGARSFSYWDNSSANASLPAEVRDLFANGEQEFLLSKTDNRFCIKVKWQEKLFGAIDVSGFMFPEYIEKYLNFALEIVKICGLVFSNNEQYEKILKSEQDLRYMSTHDALTGLYNRAYVDEILDNQKVTAPFTVFMFDLDRLKYVNDNFGHGEGDRLIQQVAHVLDECFREQDIVARIGGDEFIAIATGTTVESAPIIKTRIEQYTKACNEAIQDEHLRVSFSIGYSSKGEESEDSIAVVMRRADENMYKDKAHRRAL